MTETWVDMGGSTDYLRSGGFVVPMVLVQPINRKDIGYCSINQLPQIQKKDRAHSEAGAKTTRLAEKRTVKIFPGLILLCMNTTISTALLVKHNLNLIMWGLKEKYTR